MIVETVNLCDIFIRDAFFISVCGANSRDQETDSTNICNIQKSTTHAYIHYHFSVASKIVIDGETMLILSKNNWT